MLLLLIYLMDCLASPQQLEQSFGVGGDHPLLLMMLLLLICLMDCLASPQQLE